MCAPILLLGYLFAPFSLKPIIRLLASGLKRASEGAFGFFMKQELMNLLEPSLPLIRNVHENYAFGYPPSTKLYFIFVGSAICWCPSPLSPKINAEQVDRTYSFGTRPVTTSNNIEFGGSGGAFTLPSKVKYCRGLAPSRTYPLLGSARH